MEELMITSEIIKPTDLWKNSWGVRDSVSEILDLDDDAEWKKLLMKNIRWENMGTISYQFYDQDSDNSNCKICYMNFFGTQNGKEEKRYRKRLECLWDYSLDPKYISYEMMEEFIVKICKTRWVEKIYLDADWVDKKVFWKDKMWRYLIQHGLIQKQSSQSMEVCYVL